MNRRSFFLPLLLVASAVAQAPPAPVAPLTAAAPSAVVSHVSRYVAGPGERPQAESEALNFLTQSADLAFRAKRFKNSADLLRAAEHVSFATLNSGSTERVGNEPKAALAAEFESLLHRAEAHAAHHEAPDAVVELRERLTRESEAALKRCSYRTALEYARSAEALAHVDGWDSLALPAATSQKGLRA